MDDLYQILQVAPIADPEVIEAAFRTLARKYHPDVYNAPDANRRMQELNDAYAVLRDPAQRAAYDRKRALEPDNGRPAAPPRPPVRPAPARHAGTPHPRDRLRRQKITELNELIRQLQSEIDRASPDIRGRRIVLGISYLLVAGAAGAAAVLRGPFALDLAPAPFYAVLAGAALAAILGIALIARTLRARRRRRQRITRLRGQIKQRRRDLSQA